ncbi:MAG: IS1595 family transposase [Minisyncoccales bacterium]
MKYTIKDFKKDFPDDDTCLNYLLKKIYGEHPVCPKCGKSSFHKVSNRKCYACAWCGQQIHPTANTIFHKSETKLTDWFFAIYLMSQSKNGVSAKELERHIGCTYKTAWRMANRIRSLMTQDSTKLKGTVEADETYIGGRIKNPHKRFKNKTAVMGMVSRKGEVRSMKISDAQTHILLGNLKDNVQIGSRLITDDNHGYRKADKLGLTHDIIKHSRKQYVKGDIYTNTIEGFWSQMKRSIDGTYHLVSPKYLQSYVDEFVYQYNQRKSFVPVFQDLLYRACYKPDLTGQRIVVFEKIPVA